MHSGEEPVGLCDTGLRAVVYCLIVFNVRVYCACFLLCSLFNSACAIKDCFVLFAYAPFSTADGGTVSPCPPKLCFAVMGSHTLWNVSVRKVHTSALLLLTPVLLLFTCIPPYP